MAAPATSAPAASAFAVRPDGHCLRGLHFVYSVPALDGRDAADPPDSPDAVAARGAAERVTAGLVDRLRHAHPHHLVEDVEHWAERLVRRLIVQFRFEIQLGVRPGEISFIHRVLATPAQRAHDRAEFEAALAAAIAEETLS
jgi:hypothetical protein